ncbi:MAG: hypothetical protein KDE58_31580 [Caldilineaceae bacterium]|nr:hypothetical protein [Caldilineaceae bacterium]
MTIMNRRVFHIQPGEMPKALELLNEVGPKINFPGPCRVYHTLTGEFDRIIIEYEFADLAAYEAFWEEWSTTHAAEFMPRWRTVSLPGGSNELFVKDIEL